MIPRRSFQKRVEEEDRRLEDDRRVFLDTIPDVRFALLRKSPIVYYRPGPFSISSGINPRKIDDDELKSVRAKRERAVFPKVFITQPGMVMMLPCHVSRVRRVAVVI